MSRKTLRTFLVLILIAVIIGGAILIIQAPDTTAGIRDITNLK